MQGCLVTIGRARFKLAEPFLVLAAQNPIAGGHRPPPEAQLDRFTALAREVGYPAARTTVKILDRGAGASRRRAAGRAGHDQLRRAPARPATSSAMSSSTTRSSARAVDLVAATRDPTGPPASRNLATLATTAPRCAGSIALIGVARRRRCWAAAPTSARRRQGIAVDVLRHRILLAATRPRARARRPIT
ncbi:MAG: AAA family ATPase [Kofleriaceae bacterium]|nr:AAA family ATPase [Kofleriaceae bacterium]